MQIGHYTRIRRSSHKDNNYEWHCAFNALTYIHTDLNLQLQRKWTISQMKNDQAPKEKKAEGESIVIMFSLSVMENRLMDQGDTHKVYRIARTRIRRLQIRAMRSERHLPSHSPSRISIIFVIKTPIYNHLVSFLIKQNIEKYGS